MSNGPHGAGRSILKNRSLATTSALSARSGETIQKSISITSNMAYMSFIESLQTKKDWWWCLKTEFKF